MAIQSRSRAPRASGGQFATTHSKLASSLAKAPSAEKQQARRPLHTNHHAPPPAFNDDEPAAKRRKLSIRGKQTTLDNFAAAQSGRPKPPTKVSVAQPHGKLLETLNGVRTVLDADEDEFSLPTSGVNTPKPGRVPQPALPPANGPAKQEDKRTLRSQDEGPRLKSELAIYFPNYEDVIFDVSKEPEFITVDTAIYVTDDAPKPPKPEQVSPAKNVKNVKSSSLHARKGSVNGVQSPSTPQRTSSNQFNGSPSLNLDVIARGLPARPDDPLTDEHFLKSHRRAERKEKQLRNIEKERAMHEKVQLDRLLDGLQGHDWLKVLGITGITDGEAKKYEAKRDYFIAEVKALVDKFKQWKEQEKKQRVEKEATVAAKEENEEQDSEEGSVGPPSSDLNASAARQLQQETASALKSSMSKPSKGKEPVSATPKPQVTFAAPSPEAPFTSFYSKRHLRDAALGKARHGRSVTAFGHPVPEMDEMEFELPSDLITEDAVRANARERRRRKRESITNGSVS